MDQVKLVLNFIRKQHFWLLLALVVIIALVFWFSASRGLANRINERKSQLEQVRQQVQQVQSVSPHPNQQLIDALKQVHEQLKERVFQAWVYLYQDQQAQNKWPDELGPDFLSVIESLGPEEEIPQHLRETYQNFIANHFPVWFDIIDLRLPVKLDRTGQPVIDPATGEPVKVNPLEERPTQVGSGAYGGPTDYTGYEGPMGYEGYGDYTGEGGMSYAGSQRQLVGKVEWNLQDIQRIRAKYEWPTVPTSFQVRLAQEDLWVYEALLRIIRDTNEGSTNYYNAVIKRIQTIQIGQDAAAVFAQSLAGFGGTGYMTPMGEEGEMGGYGAMGPAAAPGMPPVPTGMPGAGMGMMPGMGEYGYEEMDEASYMAGEYGAGATAVSPEEALKIQLLNYRYVDKDGRPLPANAEPPFSEFKMMPVRMVVYMDQRKIPKLLAECANSSMPVLVRRVTLNPGRGQTIDFSRLIGSMSSAMGPGMPPGAMYGGAEYEYSEYMDSEGYPGAPSGPMGTGRSEDLAGTYDMWVEVQGIIFIFNPPDRSKLGTGAAGQSGLTATGLVPGTEAVQQPVATPGAQPPAQPAAQPAQPTQPTQQAPQPAQPPAGTESSAAQPTQPPPSQPSGGQAAASPAAAQPTQGESQPTGAQPAAGQQGQQPSPAAQSGAPQPAASGAAQP